MTPRSRERITRGLILIASCAVFTKVFQGMGLNLFLAIGSALILAWLIVEYWRKSLRHLCRARKFSAVIPGSLYRSGQISRFHIHRILKKYRIKAIVDLTPFPGESSTPCQRAEANAIGQQGLAAYRCVMRGNGTGELDSVADAVSAIHRHVVQGEPVLVHCAAGVQRTGHVLSAYLLLVLGTDPKVVYQYMERFGWEPGRSSAWPQQLNQRMGQLANLLLERGVISQIPANLPQLPLRKPQGLQPWWRSDLVLMNP